MFLFQMYFLYEREQIRNTKTGSYVLSEFYKDWKYYW